VNFRPVFFSARDGLKLYARIYEPSSAPRLTLVCLAGLTRNARDFDALASLLVKQNFKIVALDARGRGGSAYAKSVTDYNLNTEAQDVLSALDALGIHHAAFIGTSRGGLLLHLLAGMRPTALKAVILNDIGPVIEPDGLLQIRGSLQNAPRPKNWGDAVDVQKAIHAKAFPALIEADWERHARAIYVADEAGRLRADFDPKIIETLASLQAGIRLPSIWPQFMGLCSIPMMIIRGQNSRLLSQATFDEMAKRHKKCTPVVAEGQGHAPMLDVGSLPEKIIKFLKASA
jgi:pimeloyl-ACP methyl ester carboxylesterase